MVDGNGNTRSASATATVAITVEDINDNSPVLENPHPTPIDLLEVSHIQSVLSVHLYVRVLLTCICSVDLSYGTFVL